MRRILILTGGGDRGQELAAMNLCEALRVLSEDVVVAVVDPRAEVSGLRLGGVDEGEVGGVGGWRSAVRRTLGGVSGSWRIFLRRLLDEFEPDCVVSTCASHGVAFRSWLGEVGLGAFPWVSLVIGRLSPAEERAWAGSGSDLFFVTEGVAAVGLVRAGVRPECVVRTGYPVHPSHGWCDDGVVSDPAPDLEGGCGVVYVADGLVSRTLEVVDALCGLRFVRLTVAGGVDRKLGSALVSRQAVLGGRLNTAGLTERMPGLLRRSHLVVRRPEFGSFEEAVAAGCPVGAFYPARPFVGVWEELGGVGTGFFAGTVEELVAGVVRTFDSGAGVWRGWREELLVRRDPGSSLRLGERLLEVARPARWVGGVPGRDPGVREEGRVASERGAGGGCGGRRVVPSLLCDFHVHSTFSDGRLSVGELVDFYGGLGFDCICVTDHLADPRTLPGKISRLSGRVLPAEQLGEYFEVVERERRRAWRRYGMRVLTGIEFNKDGFRAGSSAHILAVGLSEMPDPALDIEPTLRWIRSCGALGIASHPHVMKTEWGWNTLHLWEQRSRYAPLLDAWEIANRQNIFNPVSLAGLPFVANSDFHQPHHIASWKTILRCERDEEAIKACVRENREVSITLFRPREGGAGQLKATGMSERGEEPEVVGRGVTG